MSQKVKSWDKTEKRWVDIQVEIIGSCSLRLLRYEKPKVYNMAVSYRTSTVNIVSMWGVEGGAEKIG